MIAVCIFSLSISKSAYALPVEVIPEGGGWLPEIFEAGAKWSVEALDDSGKTGTPIDIIILILASLTFVGSTTALAIEDYKNGGYTSEKILDILIESEDFIQDFGEDLLSKAVWTYDTSKSLLDIIALGDLYDLKEFFFPKDTIVTLNRDLSQYIIGSIKLIHGLPDFQPGVYDLSYSVFLNMIREKGFSINSNGYHILNEISSNIFRIDKDSTKDFIVHDWNFGQGIIFKIIDYVDTIELLATPNVIPGSNKYYTQYSADTTDNVNVYNFLYKFSTDNLSHTDLGLNFEGALTVSNSKSDYLEDANAFLGCHYNTFPMSITLDGHERTLPDNTGTIQVTESRVLPQEQDDEYEANLFINDYLVDIGEDFNINTMVNTDELLEALDLADEEAREAGHMVIDNPLDVTEETPELPFPLDWLWNGLKNIFEWLFVPDALFLEDTITELKTKIDNQAGLLTYPLTLIIEFLLSVADLDTESNVILKIPEIKYKEHVLYGGVLFDVKKFINDYDLKNTQNIIYAIGNFIMIIGLLNFAKRKGDEIIRGN
ncbi:MAG: hypothetical protein QXF82_02950 [Nitrososphaeria archaeon]